MNLCESKELGKQNNIISFTVSEAAYFMFASLLFMAKALGWNDGEPRFKACLILAVVCWLVKCIFTEYTIREGVLSGIFLVLAGTSYYMSGEKGILIAAMIIIGAKGIPMRKMSGAWFWIWLLGFSFVTISSFGRGIETSWWARDAREKFGITMQSSALGYTNHSVTHMTFLMCMLLLIYCYQDKLKNRDLIKMFVANLFLFLYTFSATGFVCGVICIIFIVLIRRQESNTNVGKMMGILSMLILPICISASILLPIVLNPGTFSKVDSLFTGRLKCSREYLMSGPYTLFGYRIYDIPRNGYFFLDSSYVTVLAQLGIVTFVTMIVLYEYAVYKMIKKKQIYEIAITLTALIGGLAEPYLFNTSMKNFSLFLLGAALYENESTGNVKMLSAKDRRYIFNIAWFEDFCNSLKEFRKRSPGEMRGGAICGGSILTVMFIISECMHQQNIMTHYCWQYDYHELYHIEGIRGIITWYIAGYVCVRMINYIMYLCHNRTAGRN